MNRAIGAIIGARLIWGAVRGASLRQLLTVGAGAYFLAKALGPAAPASAAHARRSIGDEPERPAPEVAADPVDEASWASFPASDPPSYSPRRVS